MDPYIVKAITSNAQNAHQIAAKCANKAVLDKYHTDTFTHGSAVHAYWLDVYDTAFRNVFQSING